MPNITQIPAPRVPFLDERTGLVSREWYRFLLNLFQLSGDGSSDLTALDMAKAPNAFVEMSQREQDEFTKGPIVTSHVDEASIINLKDSVQGLMLAPQGPDPFLPQRHAVAIVAGSMLPSFTGGCAELETIVTAADKPDITTLNFDATTAEYAQFSMAMPKGWNEGPITFIAYWSHPATTTNFGVVWGLQAVAVGNDDTINVAYGTAAEVADTGGTTDDLYITPESAQITIAGSPQPEDMVFFRVYRDPTDGSDTMAVDARLHAVVIFITVDSPADS